MEQPQQQMGSYANQGDEIKPLASIAALLKEAENLLPTLRREFRGEVMRQYENGDVEYVQEYKPVFVKTDNLTEQPLKIKVQYKYYGVKEVYVPHDEAIEEVLSMLKFMGLNNIARITNLSSENILDDLREFECKLAEVLGLKQKSWGIDKAMLPMTMTKIKTIVQDARYMACNGVVLKAIQKTVQRIESYSEGDNKKKRSLYG